MTWNTQALALNRSCWTWAQEPGSGGSVWEANSTPTSEESLGGKLHLFLPKILKFSFSASFGKSWENIQLHLSFNQMVWTIGSVINDAMLSGSKTRGRPTKVLSKNMPDLGMTSRSIDVSGSVPPYTTKNSRSELCMSNILRKMPSHHSLNH